MTMNQTVIDSTTKVVCAPEAFEEICNFRSQDGGKFTPKAQRQRSTAQHRENTLSPERYALVEAPEPEKMSPEVGAPPPLDESILVKPTVDVVQMTPDAPGM